MEATMRNVSWRRILCCASILAVLPIPASGLAGAAEAPARSGKAELDYPPSASLDEVRALIEKAPRGHPRLLADADGLAAARRAVERGGLARALGDAVVRQADLLDDVPAITREQEGRRLLGQSRRCVERVVTLAMAHHLTGEDRYVRRAEKEMLTAAGFADWNPSHFLDVAEMTFALAIGYDWLHDRLDPESRGKIREAIVRKGVVLPFETAHRGWVKARNNWGQVCHGGLCAGALAVLEDEPDLAARTVHNAIQHVTHSMAAYAPRGGYPEGPGYWDYGTSYNVLLIGVLESALGTDFGLSLAPGFGETGQYPALMCGPSGEFFNYADGGAGRGPQPALYWFASRHDRPDWLLGEADRLRARIAALRARDAGSGGSRLLPLALLWMGRVEEGMPIRMPLHWQSGGETPVTVHRSSWTDPRAVFVGLKGGSPSANHGQMDVGSFVLDADGERWALDLGAEGYHRIESRGMNLWDRGQGSDRWKIFRQRNDGHNTLVIDGRLQRAAGTGEIVGFSDAPAFPHSVVDMTSVYEGQASSVRRGVALLPSREVLIQDHLRGLRPGARVRWGMITRGEPVELGAPRVELRQGGARLALGIIAPSDRTWSAVDTAKPREEWDSPNPGTRMVAFESVAPESGELVLAVIATPGSCEDSVGARIELRPLDGWGG